MGRSQQFRFSSGYKTLDYSCKTHANVKREAFDAFFTARTDRAYGVTLMHIVTLIKGEMVCSL